MLVAGIFLLLRIKATCFVSGFYRKRAARCRRESHGIVSVYASTGSKADIDIELPKEKPRYLDTTKKKQS